MADLFHQQERPSHRIDLRIPAIEKYAYCLCLHVRPTTIFIAVFKLIRALLLASIILNSELSMHEQSSDLGIAIDDKTKSTHVALHVISRLIAASAAAAGIYAVISGRAALLMPLHAMLLVDFLFYLPACYNHDHEVPMGDSFVDFRNHPAGPNQHNRYTLLLSTIVAMIVKIYFLCVVWKCYRYLRLIELVTPLSLSEVYPHVHQSIGPQYPIVRVLGSMDSNDIGSGNNLAPPPYDSIAVNMKPPNYEQAMKSTSMALPTMSPSDSVSDQFPQQAPQQTQQTEERQQNTRHDQV